MPKVDGARTGCIHLAAVGCLLAVLLGTGCVGVKHQRLLTPEADASADGIRYYRASPYLLIHPDNAGGGNWEIKYLPDQSKKMSAVPYAHFAKSDLTLEFVNGVLKSSIEEADATAVPNAIVDAIAKIVPTLMAPNALGLVATSPPEPEIFKIIVTSDFLELRGKSKERTFRTQLGEAK